MLAHVSVSFAQILSSETPEYWVQEVQPTEQEIDPKDVEKAPSGGKDKKEVVPSGEKLKKDDKKEAPSGGKEKNDVGSVVFIDWANAFCKGRLKGQFYFHDALWHEDSFCCHAFIECVRL